MFEIISVRLPSLFLGSNEIVGKEFEKVWRKPYTFRRGLEEDGPALWETLLSEIFMKKKDNTLESAIPTYKDP